LRVYRENFMKKLSIFAVACAALMAAACTSTGNIERNAAGGAAIGAVGGAIIGNNVGDGNAGRGAAIGAAVGGGAGVLRGMNQDRKVELCRTGTQTAWSRDVNGRDFYTVGGTSQTCWGDGTPRN
jgi:uncharacterized protein YcfJ